MRQAVNTWCPTCGICTTCSRSIERQSAHSSVQRCRRSCASMLHNNASSMGLLCEKHNKALQTDQPVGDRAHGAPCGCAGVSGSGFILRGCGTASWGFTPSGPQLLDHSTTCHHQQHPTGAHQCTTGHNRAPIALETWCSKGPIWQRHRSQVAGSTRQSQQAASRCCSSNSSEPAATAATCRFNSGTCWKRCRPSTSSSSSV